MHNILLIINRYYDYEESDDEDSEEEEIDCTTNSFGQICCLEWDKRRGRLEHDYSIAGWALGVMPDVYADCKSRYNGEHQDALERVVRKLHMPPCPNKHKDLPSDPDKIVELFFEELKCFRNKLKPFDKAYKWNATSALKGKSHEWHETHSLPYTVVLGFVACRVCSKPLGIGPCERSWGGVKDIKTGKRAHLSGEATEKRAILYTTALMNRARIRRLEKERIDEAVSPMFSDDDIK